MPTINAPTPDATTTAKGKIQLAGDLMGTAAAPVVVNGFAVQSVSTNFTAAGTGTTVIPIDDTIPQNTEGTEFMTQAITPKSTTNTLIIEATITCSYSVAAWLQAALFQDASVNAIAATGFYQASNAGFVNLALRHVMPAGTTSSTTFRVRCGGDQPGTFTFNGSGGTRRYGGITLSNMRITEHKS